MSDEHQNQGGPAARTVQALLALSDGPRSLGQISETTHLPKPTAHRLLDQLIQADVVYQAPNQDYMLGVRALELGQALLNAPAWSQAFTARPELADFARRTGETVTMHVRLGDYRLCIAEFESTNVLRYVGGVGQTAALHVGSAGKILLAFAAESDCVQYLTSLAHPNGGPGRPAVDIGGLRRKIAKVRAAGWAESTGERIEGASAVSVPVRDADGVLLACLSVLGPTMRLSDKVRRALVPELRTMATRIGGVAVANGEGERGGS